MIKKKKNDEQYVLNKPKSTVIFTYSPTSVTTFFSVVVRHSVIYYYFIWTYKKLTSQ